MFITNQMIRGIDILFRLTDPEKVMDTLRRERGEHVKADFCVTSSCYSQALFQHYASVHMHEYSPDETNAVFEILSEHFEGKAGVLDILAEAGDGFLTLDPDKEPICRVEYLLKWQDFSHRLGQDLIITAWLARRLLCDKEFPKPEIFRWPPGIRTDNAGITELIEEKEIAENHFHLHGSTQSFPLNWTYLMNNPAKAKEEFEKHREFRENLQVGVLRSERDYVAPWDQRICLAALIRGLLFARIAGLYDEEKIKSIFWDYDLFRDTRDIQRLINSLRDIYGVQFTMPAGGRFCLDYLISKELYEPNEKCHIRLLEGERAFLYQCFYRSYGKRINDTEVDRDAEANHDDGADCARTEDPAAENRECDGQVFSEMEKDLFYLYILIREAFRSELIQVNNRPGFKNFAFYQDRKLAFVGDENNYYSESLRLSAARALGMEKINHLEERIMPSQTGKSLRDYIRTLDYLQVFAMEGLDTSFSSAQEQFVLDEAGRIGHFYTIHFGKSSENRTDLENSRRDFLPRNSKVRRKSQSGAFAIAECLKKDPLSGDLLRRRIRGIDACSNEIGCRPEVFAPVMRFLRAEDSGLGLTYHVGEDFLDLADGLRAVWEAITFIHMHEKDRIGHGLVMGIDPEKYYSYKKSSITMPKHDRLDDLVWILESDLLCLTGAEKKKLRQEANGLYNEIYGNTNEMDWENTFFSAMKLRGNDPRLFKTGKYIPWYACGAVHYYEQMTDFDSRPELASEKVGNLYYRYHYDYDARKKGMNYCSFSVDKWYIRLMRRLQDSIRKLVIERRLKIECNPTSNVLIGTFGRYIEHPIFVFDPVRKRPKGQYINVSVNTDDLGVFDTTLSNEYALIYAAASAKGYGHTEIMGYLGRLRQNGVDMLFQR